MAHESIRKEIKNYFIFLHFKTQNEVNVFIISSLFGKAKAAKTAPKDAILKLRESLEMLEKRESYLQTKIDGELAVARANATKNKKSNFI